MNFILRNIESLIVLGALLVAFLLSGMRCVPVGNLGVVKHWGKVNHEMILPEGFHFVTPVRTSLAYVNIKLLKFSERASSSSKDLQNVSTLVSVQFSLGNVSHLFQKIGDQAMVTHVLLKPAVQESVKAVMARYTAEELIKKRPEVKDEISHTIVDFLEETLASKDLDKKSLRLANVAITDFNFSEEFNRSIEMKVRAEQQALQAKNEKIKKITDAEATAEKIRIESIASSNAIRIEGQALKENPLYIDFKRIEKWDGKLPHVTGGVVPMFNLNNKSTIR